LVNFGKKIKISLETVNFEPRLTNFEPSLTKFEPSLTKFEPSLIFKFYNISCINTKCLKKLSKFQMYFYHCTMSTHHKLGITSRHLLCRKREYQQSCGIVNYYNVVKLDCTRKELSDLEQRCLRASYEYRCKHMDDFGESVHNNNETRWDITAEKLWGLCMSEIKKCPFPWKLVNIADEIGVGDVRGIANDADFVELRKEWGNMSMRDSLQEEYTREAINLLNANGRCLLKAPTGFGKTRVYFNVIERMNPKKVIILTPRINLNKQLSQLLQRNGKYEIFEMVGSPENRQLALGGFYASESAVLVLCYQGAKRLSLKADLMIFDEAHYLEKWDAHALQSRATHCLFGTATPFDTMEQKADVFGEVVEKVKVYELMRYGILCDINTIIRSFPREVNIGIGGYPNYLFVADMIMDNMRKYNKQRGLIYTNCQENALSLFRFLSGGDEHRNAMPCDVYILTSKHKHANSAEKDSGVFEKDSGVFEKDSGVFEKDSKILEKFGSPGGKPALIVSVEMLSYGYDNPLVDFICFADPKHSPVGIRQAIGRGLRKSTQPKTLHVLLPVYRKEFGVAYPALKEYLNYIIGECGQEVIHSNKHGKIGYVINEVPEPGSEVRICEGEIIDSEILREYCTDRHARFGEFIRFLRENGVHDEETYRALQSNAWLPDVDTLVNRYGGRFGFKLLNKGFYETREEALSAIEVAKEKIKVEGKIIPSKKRRMLHVVDNKIPYDDLELFYPLKN